MKHLKHTLETCVYNHCNIQIYFCNIQMKYLQLAYETPKTPENIRLKHACYETSGYTSATSR
jgi:hypothetical protein